MSKGMTRILLDHDDAKMLQAALTWFLACNESKITSNEKLKDTYMYLNNTIEEAVIETEEDF